MIKPIIIAIACFSLCSCAYMLDAVKGVSSMLGSSSNEGTQVDTSLDFQNGDNKYKMGGADFDNAKFKQSQIAGHDQYHANEMVIQKSNFYEIIFALCLGLFIACMFFWCLEPHPKKICKTINNKLKQSIKK